MKKIFSIVAAIAVSMCLFSCGDSPSKVDYSVADGYFVRNDVQGRVPGTISSQEMFSEWFGTAAVMGGLPTPIDFASKCVIPIDLGKRDIDTTIEIEDVEVPSKGKIRVLYKIIEDDPISYTMRPCALVLVDSKYAGYDLELKVVE